MYSLFPWDCSSIGQSTALSRRKLRVRAPSVPTDPNPIKKIHQFIYAFAAKRRTKQIAEFHSQEDTLIYLLVFYLLVSHFSSNKYGNYHLFN
jgi:hypothetical protein